MHFKRTAETVTVRGIRCGMWPQYHPLDCVEISSLGLDRACIASSLVAFCGTCVFKLFILLCWWLLQSLAYFRFGTLVERIRSGLICWNFCSWRKGLQFLRFVASTFLAFLFLLCIYFSDTPHIYSLGRDCRAQSDQCAPSTYLSDLFIRTTVKYICHWLRRARSFNWLSCSFYVLLLQFAKVLVHIRGVFRW
jgi:hypothetical protein